jgi:hypothetical protein
MKEMTEEERKAAVKMLREKAKEILEEDETSYYIHNRSVSQ